MTTPFNATVAIAEPTKATNAQIIARIEYCVAQYDIDLTDHLDEDQSLKRLKKSDLVEVLDQIEVEVAEAIVIQDEDATNEKLDDAAEESDYDLWNDGEEPEGTDLEVAEEEAVAVTSAEVKGDEVAVSSDNPPAAAKTKKVKVEDKRTVPELLAELAASKYQSERKKIRALLRAKGYKISEHKVKAPKAEKPKVAAVASPTSPIREKAKKGGKVVAAPVGKAKKK